MTKTIAFDADDTLWENERFFREAENEFCRIMMRFGKEEDLSSCLFSVETDNMPLYGYGIKAFTLSMIEAAGKIAGRMLTQDDTHAIINIRQITAAKACKTLRRSTRDTGQARLRTQTRAGNKRRPFGPTSQIRKIRTRKIFFPCRDNAGKNNGRLHAFTGKT